MYPSFMHLYDNYPYSQDAYLYSNPSQEYNDYDAAFDERQFGTSLPQMGPPGFPPLFPPPGQGPGFPPPSQGPGVGPPIAPPPSFIPTQAQQVQPYAVDPGSIVRCLFRYTYVWLRGFEQFWFYPTFVGRNSVSGYRWTGFRWVYYGISLRQIQSFTCF